MPPSLPDAPSPPTLNYLRPLFVEEQRFGVKQVALPAAILGTVTLALALVGRRLGTTALLPGVFALVCVSIGTALLATFAKMTTVVDAAGVHVRYFPVLRRTFRLDEIVKWEAVTYDPTEYGGWGVRGFPDRYGWAYNVRGNRGVHVEFGNRHRLMLGSQRAEELATAIAEAKAGG